jgi:hypothetical protein
MTLLPRTPSHIVTFTILVLFLLTISHRCYAEDDPVSYSPQNMVCGTSHTCQQLCHKKGFHPSLSGSNTVFFACEVGAGHYYYEAAYCAASSLEQGASLDVGEQRILCGGAGGRICGHGNRTRCLMPDSLYSEYYAMCNMLGLSVQGATMTGYIYPQAFRLAGCDDSS